MCKICNKSTTDDQEIWSTTKANKFKDEPANTKPIGQFKTVVTNLIKLTMTKPPAIQTTIMPKTTSALKEKESTTTLTFAKLTTTKIIETTQTKTSTIIKDSISLKDKPTTNTLAASSTKLEANNLGLETSKSNKLVTESVTELITTNSIKSEEELSTITLGYEITKVIKKDSEVITTPNNAKEDSTKSNEPIIGPKLEQTTQQANEFSASGVCNPLECENLGIFNAQTCQCDCMSGYYGPTCDKFDCNSLHLDPTECASLIESDNNACSDQSTKSFCPKTCLCSAN
jgi:hypothetical protein